MKNTITLLKTLKKKNTKTVKLCQELCYKTWASHFKWSKKKKTCFCQAVDYKNKKKYYSGPVMC